MVKAVEEFDLARQWGAWQQCADLGSPDFIAPKENAGFLGPPGAGGTHIATGLAVGACRAGRRVVFASAALWVGRLAAAHDASRMQDELVRLGRYPLIVIVEVGCIPFEAEAANLDSVAQFSARDAVLTA